MSAPGMSPRSGADVELERSQRRARQAALKEQLARVTTESKARRAEQARATADGTAGPAVAEIAGLAQEMDALTSALDLLESDLEHLDDEALVVARAEAKVAEGDAIAVASAITEETAALVWEVCERQILPAADRMVAALRAAREAENHHDSLNRRANGDDGYTPDRTGQVTARRGALLQFIANLRGYVGRPRTPHVEAQSLEQSRSSRTHNPEFARPDTQEPPE